MKFKKGQTNGLITGLVFGIASLVIGVIIAFVVVTTLADSNLLSGARITTSVINESQNGTNHVIVYANTSGYQLTAPTVNFLKSISLTSALGSGRQSNGSQSNFSNAPVGGYNTTIPITDFKVTAQGVVTNATIRQYGNVSITYTFTESGAEERTTDNLRVNFSEGIDRVSEKIPTVLLIAAVVLIISVLALLVGVWQRMRMGGSEL